ncbi:MAG: RNA methyltransferase [Oscillospiraceae bacterium]|nr:RNA methyltransferase [Oscillospiraceae bacterium]
MPTITSRQNAVIQQATRLRDSAAARRETERLFLEGARLVHDAALSGLTIHQLFLTPDAQKKYAERLRDVRAAESYEIQPHVAALLSDTRTPQGVFAVCALPRVPAPDWTDTTRALALEQIQDPGNLGTILRTAEAFGLDAVFLCDCADVYGAKALRAGMGAAFRLPIVPVADLPVWLRDAGAQGVRTLAAVPTRGAQTIDSLRTDGAGALLVALGNEGNGLTRETVAACAAPVTIPMRGRAESLSVASAAAVICWEICR